MADTLDVITLDEAKAYLNITQTTWDTELDDWITAVSRRLDALCGPIVVRTITSEAWDGTVDGVRQTAITLRYRPVSSVTSVTEYSSTTGTTLTVETNAAKTSSNYYLNTTTGVLTRRSGNRDYVFADGRQNIVITYVAGRYANTASVDARFKVAAGMMLANLWRREQGGGTQTFGESDPFGLVATFAVPRAVEELLHEDLVGPRI